MSEADFEQLLSLFPIVIIGFCVGLSSFFTQVESSESSESKHKAIKRLIKQVILSLTLCLIVYSILSATDLPYLAKIGISCAIGFFGIDKALTIVQNILNLKNNNKKGVG